MKNNLSRTYLADFGSVIVFENGDVWIFHDNHWLHLEGRFAGAFEDVFEKGISSSRLQGLKRTGVPYADRVVRIAASKTKRPLTTTQSPAPRSLLFMELTGRCNLQCTHCYSDSSPLNYQYLDITIARNAVREARELDFQNIQFTGGEPLLHPGFRELVNLAHEEGIPSVEVYTNGNLVTAGLLDKIPESTHFALSFYSHDLEVHDRITKRHGSGKATLETIDLLLDRGFQTRVGCILMDENAGDWEKTRELLIERGIPEDRVGFNFVASVGRGGEGGTTVQLGQKKMKIALPAEETMVPGLAEEYVWSGKACIDPLGDVHPCIFSRSIQLGNLGERSLTQILNSPRSAQNNNRSVPERWDYVSRRLSCLDCRMQAFHLLDAH